jgi:hypothetical protein
MLAPPTGPRRQVSDARILNLALSHLHLLTNVERRAIEILRYLEQIRMVRTVRSQPSDLTNEEAAHMFSRIMLPELQSSLLEGWQELGYFRDRASGQSGSADTEAAWRVDAGNADAAAPQADASNGGDASDATAPQADTGNASDATAPEVAGNTSNASDATAPQDTSDASHVVRLPIQRQRSRSRSRDSERTLRRHISS